MKKNGGINEHGTLDTSDCGDICAGQSGAGPLGQPLLVSFHNFCGTQLAAIWIYTLVPDGRYLKKNRCEAIGKKRSVGGTSEVPLISAG
jgi:hypothetical protein